VGDQQSVSGIPNPAEREGGTSNHLSLSRFIGSSMVRSFVVRPLRTTNLRTVEPRTLDPPTLEPPV
jgi:hypothetical protein